MGAPEGYVEMGKRFAKKAVKLIRAKKQPFWQEAP